MGKDNTSERTGSLVPSFSCFQRKLLDVSKKDFWMFPKETSGMPQKLTSGLIGRKAVSSIDTLLKLEYRVEKLVSIYHSGFNGLK